MENKKELPLCPVATTVGLIGNKWKLLILRELLSGTKRFGELRNGIEGISQKVLTQNLRSMEEDGIIGREVYAEVPPRVEYFLSDLGNTLRPIINVMEEWGLGYQEMANNNPNGSKSINA
ncbi:winged helix-turn-helix transcriptional regulator [Priestia megaterium]